MQLVSLTKAMRFLIVLTVVCLAAIAVPFSAADSAATAPKGLAFDDKGNLFVADSGTGTILKFTPEGTRSTFASGLNAPIGLAFDVAGNLFVADKEIGTIFKF